MKKFLFVSSLFLIFTIFTGCSSSSTEESKDKLDSGSIESTAPEHAEDKEMATIDNSSKEEENIEKETPTSSELDDIKNERMVIYTADLSILVSSYDHTLTFIENEVISHSGYIVESNSYSIDEGESVEGTITVRIPQEKFHEFLQSVEKGSTKIINKSIVGQDVTEEFVDLESRLKSKQVVEKRLVDFMEKAEKTEDLLKISTDLATVQEEIEQIKGRMNYLTNKVNLATVSIHVSENKVNIPALDNKDLNTWEKTGKQFMESVNFLLNFVSALIIFIIGSLPVLLVLGGFVIVTLITMKKRRKAKELKPPKPNDE
ncbi:DUF4349 domain-containing protein [Metabacillus litoralis]|uniref:DUF4349 domain-containing protein n=1 Tax=Metabacillus litoralis TaxID=152268 RepID=UPI001CFCFBD1|nr:DUF4349 domain-containing protein [Metabacillus litoralis]